MGTNISKIVRAVLVVTAVSALATAVAAQTLPRLPEDSVFPLGEGSPGEVTFRHASHVDMEKPACTACHPTLFRILGGPAPARAVSYHAEMEEGRRCAACHDGTAAFGLDDCLACHRTE